jgi:ADP-heptose:LPS heptosyltransferase
LVIRGGAIGDFILTLPVLQALKARWPDSEIELIGYPRIAELAVHAGYVSRVRSLDEAWVAQLFIPGVHLPPAKLTYIREFDIVISYLYDPDQLVGKNLENNGAKQVLLGSHRREDVTAHAIDFFIAPLAELAIFPEDDVPVVVVPDPGAERTLAIHPGSGSPFKNWPLDRYMELADRWIAECGPVGFVLGEADDTFEAVLRERFPNATWMVNLSLVELAESLKTYTAYAGNDTGITHLAAACGVPVTALFGPTDPAIWSPRGPEVKVMHHDVLREIAVDSVLESLQSHRA